MRLSPRSLCHGGSGVPFLSRPATLFLSSFLSKRLPSLALQRAKSTLRPGLRGFLVTCEDSGREREALFNAYDLLNEVWELLGACRLFFPELVILSHCRRGLIGPSQRAGSFLYLMPFSVRSSTGADSFSTVGQRHKGDR